MTQEFTAKSVEDEMLVAISTLPPALRARAEAYPFPQLHHACVDCDLELITALLNAGLSADMYPCTEDEDDEPPLVWIAQRYDGELGPARAAIDILLGWGAGIDEGCPLLAAAERGHAGLMKIFIAAGADVDEALGEDPSIEAEALILKAQIATATIITNGGLFGPLSRL